jgi:hypothetical protein
MSDITTILATESDASFPSQPTIKTPPRAAGTNGNGEEEPNALVILSQMKREDEALDLDGDGDVDVDQIEDGGDVDILTVDVDDVDSSVAATLSMWLTSKSIKKKQSPDSPSSDNSDGSSAAPSSPSKSEGFPYTRRNKMSRVDYSSPETATRALTSIHSRGSKKPCKNYKSRVSTYFRVSSYVKAYREQYPDSIPTVREVIKAVGGKSQYICDAFKEVKHNLFLNDYHLPTGKRGGHHGHYSYLCGEAQ